MTVESEENFIDNLTNAETSALFIGKINNEIVCVGSIMAPPKERIRHQADLAISVKKKFIKRYAATSIYSINKNSISSCRSRCLVGFQDMISDNAETYHVMNEDWKCLKLSMERRLPICRAVVVTPYWTKAKLFKWAVQYSQAG